MGGQVLDLGSKLRDKTAEKLLLINSMKTAKLFEVSARLGAIAASAGEEKKRTMAKYGAELGMAFQIVDDIMDNEGYARMRGKAKAAAYSKELIRRAKGRFVGFLVKRVYRRIRLILNLRVLQDRALVPG